MKEIVKDSWDNESNTDFNTEFPTYILAFCPDTDTWFATNKRFFFYEYDKEFQTKDEAELFFCKNAQIFYDIKENMKIK